MYVFYVFLRFFQNPKKHDFLRFFELLHTFSRTVSVCTVYSLSVQSVCTDCTNTILVYRQSVQTVVCKPYVQSV